MIFHTVWHTVWFIQYDLLSHYLGITFESHHTVSHWSILRLITKGHLLYDLQFDIYDLQIGLLHYDLKSYYLYLNWSNLFFFWEIFRENFSKLTVPMGNKITQTDEIGIIIGSMAFLLVILLFVNFIWLSLSNKCQKLPKNHKTHIWSARSKCNQGDWQDLNNIFKTVLQIN